MEVRFKATILYLNFFYPLGQVPYVPFPSQNPPLTLSALLTLPILREKINILTQCYNVSSLIAEAKSLLY